MIISILDNMFDHNSIILMQRSEEQVTILLFFQSNP